MRGGGGGGTLDCMTGRMSDLQLHMSANWITVWNLGNCRHKGGFESMASQMWYLLLHVAPNCTTAGMRGALTAWLSGIFKTTDMKGHLIHHCPDVGYAAQCVW